VGQPNSGLYSAVLVCVIFDALYVAWSALHSYLDIGNPDESDNDETTNDDAVYTVLAWKNKAEETGTLAVIILGILASLVFLVIWMLSVYSPFCKCSGYNRPYMSNMEREKDYNQMKVKSCVRIF
jgi:hypothetical protein